MTETKTPAPTKTPSAAVEKKPIKTFGKILSDGKTERLRLLAVVRPDGSAISYITHQIIGPENKVTKSTRGATQEHPNLEAAKKAVLAGIEKAKAKGWTAGRPGGGFRAQPDAFDFNTLPAAGGAKKR